MHQQGNPARSMSNEHTPVPDTEWGHAGQPQQQQQEHAPVAGGYEALPPMRPEMEFKQRPY